MIENDLETYLGEIDKYVNRSIELIEQASSIYGKYIDNSGFKPEIVAELKKIIY